MTPLINNGLQTIFQIHSSYIFKYDTIYVATLKMASPKLVHHEPLRFMYLLSLGREIKRC
jgi:hypothetical protein